MATEIENNGGSKPAHSSGSESGAAPDFALLEWQQTLAKIPKNLRDKELVSLVTEWEQLERDGKAKAPPNTAALP